MLFVFWFNVAYYSFLIFSFLFSFSLFFLLSFFIKRQRWLSRAAILSFSRGRSVLHAFQGYHEIANSFVKRAYDVTFNWNEPAASLEVQTARNCHGDGHGIDKVERTREGSADRHFCLTFSFFLFPPYFLLIFEYFRKFILNRPDKGNFGIPYNIGSNLGKYQAVTFLFFLPISLYF